MRYLLLLAALPCALLAQALEGTWQGTLIPPNQNDGIRLAFKIDKNGNTYQGTFYNLANGRQLNLGAITLQGNAVTATELLSRNTSLADIITFAFEIHVIQLSGLPGWAKTEK